MNTFVRCSCAALFAGGLFVAAGPGRAAGPDFSLIAKLPAREVAAKKTAHQGWDSGATTKILDATNEYNNALTAMITELVTAYYGKAKVTKEDVTAYVKTLNSAATFRHKLDNPTNEDRGAMDSLEAPSVVSSDLEDTVEQMVEAVTADDEHFDYPTWEKRWEEARKTGDLPEKETAAAPGTTASKNAPTEKRNPAD